MQELTVPNNYSSPPSSDIEAVERGLNFILRLVLDEDNFKTFGSDAFQTFYDIATTAEEPLRQFALLRTEVAAQMWLHSYPVFGQEANGVGEPEGGASADEVLDFVMGIYALERVGIGHDSKEAVRAAAAKYDTEDFFGVPASSFVRTSSTMPAMEMRDFTNALTYTFYAGKVGIDVKLSLDSVVSYLPMFRPYRKFSSSLSRDDDDFEEYADQLTLIFNYVHVLSNYGEFRLSASLLPQEIEYLQDASHIDRAIAFRDVHLAGEICHCLRVLGVAPSHSSMTKGLAFLREMQSLEDGSWPARDDADDGYFRYHAAMCAISALNPQRFRGFGPADPRLYSTLASIRYSTRRGDVTPSAPAIASYLDVPVPSSTAVNDAIQQLSEARASSVLSESNLAPLSYGKRRLDELLATSRFTNNRYRGLQPERKQRIRKRKSDEEDDVDWKPNRL